MKLHTHLTRGFLMAGLSLSMAVAQTPDPAASPQNPETRQQTDRTGQSGTERTGQTRTDRTDHADRTGQTTDPHTSTKGHVAGAAGERSRAAADQSMVGPRDRQFITEAAQGNMMEVKVAQMAQQKAASDEVKQFAQKLEQDHSKAGEQLRAIAQQRQVDLPDDPGHHQRQLDRLDKLSGEEFDRAFLKMQVDHHKKDISKFEKQSKHGMDTDLKEFAQQTLPTLKEHHQRAQELNRGTGVRSRQQ